MLMTAKPYYSRLSMATPTEQPIVNRLVELNGAVRLLPWSPRCKSPDHDAEQERTRAASVQRALAIAASYEAADAMIADEAADAMIVVRGIAI